MVLEVVSPPSYSEAQYLHPLARVQAHPGPPFLPGLSRAGLLSPLVEYDHRVVHERREHGFERVGRCGPQPLGLSGARAVELRLALAWNEAAGPELARRAKALGVRAGVLEVEVADPCWSDALSELLPRLAARVAACDARLGVRRCRLIVRDGDGVRRGAVLDVARTDEPRAKAERARRDHASRPSAGLPSRAEIESRLRDAAEILLARRDS